MVSVVGDTAVIPDLDLLIALMIIVLLAVREIALAASVARMTRWIRPMTIALVPLLIVFAILGAVRVVQLL